VNEVETTQSEKSGAAGGRNAVGDGVRPGASMMTRIINHDAKFATRPDVDDFS